MLTKIKMQGVASYRKPVVLETNKKVNIIYGLNGTGKSTLSNYLYDTSCSKYKDCSTDQNDDDTILVYNQQFIRDHFYEADSLKGVFSLSKENREIEERVAIAESELSALQDEAEDTEMRVKNLQAELAGLLTRAQETVFEIKRAYAGGDRVLEYCLVGLKNKAPLFSHLSSLRKPDVEPERGIKQIKESVEMLTASGDNVDIQNLLPLYSFHEHSIEKSEVFSELIVGNTDSPIASLITKLNNSDWVKDGLKFISKESVESTTECPFCQEKTITNELVKRIDSYFDQSYEDSVTAISSYLERYQAEVNKLASMDDYRACSFSQKHISKLTEAHRDLERILFNNLALIEKKLETPSSRVTLENTEKKIAAFNDIIELINIDISDHNSRLGNIDNELEVLKREFWSLMRWQYDQTIAPYFDENERIESLVIEAQEHLVDLNELLKAKTVAISELQKSTINIEEAVTNINIGLGNLGITEFSLQKYDSDLYRIVRADTSEEVFSSLSEGEKMIISFLYFCEVCRGKRSATEIPTKKVIVIDDPVSSLSHIFVYNVGQLIKSDFFSSSSFDQIFILTHSLYFFYELTDTKHDRRRDTQKLFRLTKNTDGSCIKPMRYEEIQNDYQSYWAMVIDENQPPALIANCMRNIIEYFFNFVQKAELSNVTQKPELRGNRFQAFCRFINRESHSLGQNIFDFKEFNYDDFREGLRLVFEVTGYSEHYEKMVSSIGV